MSGERKGYFVSGAGNIGYLDSKSGRCPTGCRRNPDLNVQNEILVLGEHKLERLDDTVNGKVQTTQERDVSHCVPPSRTNQNNRQERKEDLPKGRRSALDIAGNTVMD